MTYGFDAEQVMVSIDSYDRVSTERSGVLCRRHADAMVVPLGWMLDDRRDPVPRLFKAPAQTTAAAPRQRRATRHHRDDTEQLELAADLLAVDLVDDLEADVVTDAADVPGETEVLPWKPTFDQTDDLDGLLEATSPLLARAFGGQERPRRSN
jgi:hypothetical protein